MVQQVKTNTVKSSTLVLTEKPPKQKEQQKA